MAGWFFQNNRMVEALADLPPNDEAAFRRTVNYLRQQLFPAQTEPALSAELRAGLLAQAGWLAIAGHPQHAQHAVLLAQAFQHVRPGEHPLMVMMLEIGLLLLMERKQKGSQGEPA